MSSFFSVKKLKGFYRVTVNSRYCGTSRDRELVSSIKRVLKAGFHWRRSRSRSQSASRLVNIENRSRKARLHVKGGGTARVEMSTGSDKTRPFIRASFVRERIKRWHGPQTIEERQRPFTRCFFRDRNR